LATADSISARATRSISKRTEVTGSGSYSPLEH
jgi:hypothetical protein